MEQNSTDKNLITLDKLMTFVHRCIFVLSWAMLLFSVIYTLISYGKLDTYIGIHFGPDGYFDNYGAKNWTFYPIICSLIILSIITFVNFKINKVKLGFNVTERGGLILRKVFRTVYDVVIIVISIFFTEWTICIINQFQLYTVIPVFAVYAISASFVFLLIMLIVIKKVYKYVPPAEDVKPSQPLPEQITKIKPPQTAKSIYKKQKNKHKSKNKNHKK